MHTLPMQRSPRCGARTRQGSPCQSPAVKGRRRCRMHGGAAGSGAPAGNRNALKHGRYTRELIEFRRAVRKLLRESADKARAGVDGDLALRLPSHGSSRRRSQGPVPTRRHPRADLTQAAWRQSHSAHGHIKSGGESTKVMCARMQDHVPRKGYELSPLQLQILQNHEREYRAGRKTSPAPQQLRNFLESEAWNDPEAAFDRAIARAFERLRREREAAAQATPPPRMLPRR